jgi:hypothetical protein
MAPASARARGRAQARTTIAPRGPRRVSGPVARRAVALPAGAASIPRRTGTTGLFARVRALPEHRVVDRLLRSRLWIWALGALLGGIVTMQVSLLKLNSGISRAVETTTTLERQNAALEASIARLSAPDRIETGAGTLGMLMPAAGDVDYLRAGPEDAGQAARKMQPPSDEAAALLANAGILPGSLAAATVAPAAAVDPAATTTTTPVAQATDAAAAAVEPVATAEPVVTPDPAAATTVTTTPAP